MTFEETLKTKLIDHFDKREIDYFIRVFTEDMPILEDADADEWKSIAERLIDQEPIQYITGLAPFYGYFFQVNPSVLIPRPETEELVYLIHDFIKKTKLDTPKILDIGSGSGCIPITLSLLNTDAEITSIDVSEEALVVAKSNNSKLGSKVNFKKVDILKEDHWRKISGKFDIIVSNPPYIPNKEKSLMSANVLDHEPHIALFVEDQNPLIFYNKIHNFAANFLKANGTVFLECNEFNAQEVKEIYRSQYSAEIINDMQGKERMVIARK
ncbi:MAG: release factor glutamine methyltransferase [Saprospiraceae bacterium]|jgi:release factor glutamine methyltransferase